MSCPFARTRPDEPEHTPKEVGMAEQFPKLHNWTTCRPELVFVDQNSAPHSPALLDPLVLQLPHIGIEGHGDYMLMRLGYLSLTVDSLCCS